MCRDLSTLNEALDQVRQSDCSITFVEGKLDNRILSYRELYQRGLYLLHDFQQAGLKAGDQLILFTKNNQSFIEAFWACISGGIMRQFQLQLVLAMNTKRN